MRLATLTLLLPIAKSDAVGILAEWSTRGDQNKAASIHRVDRLGDHFNFGNQPLPVAALTRERDCAHAQQGIWLRADPAFVMADAVTLRLMLCGKMQLSTNDVAAFSESVAPLFSESGLVFDAPHPERWYLRCPSELALPIFSTPEDALGDDLTEHFPRGDNARFWRGLLNEVQIVLTQHPLNAQRALSGLPPVNSLWFWGAGALPRNVRCAFTQVYSNDPVVLGLAKLARISSYRTLTEAANLVPSALASPGERVQGTSPSRAIGARSKANAIEPEPRSPKPLAQTVKLFGGGGFEATALGGDDKVLLDLADLRDPAELQAGWLAPIDAALRAGEIKCLHLEFASGERIVVKPAHRWRFWRRVPQARTL